MLPNYDLIDNFLPFGSMKATAGQNILLGVVLVFFLQTVIKIQLYIIIVVLTLVYLQNLPVFY